MLIYILTLFPRAIEGYLKESILKIAQEKGLVEIRLYDFRAHAKDRHRTVDDRPFGGGPGMLLKPEPIFDAVETVEAKEGKFHKVLLTPEGKPFRQEAAARLAKVEKLLFLCGRYEGFDERIRQGFEWDEISLGDFVLSGGEIPALAVVEALVRLVPGVVGDSESVVRESFTTGRLDYPQYTRPREFRGMQVPETLVSGDHEEVRRWREAEARKRTHERRPDLESE